MAKKCTCDHLLETLRNDPRIRILPAGARWLFFAFADAVMRLPTPGVFMLGLRVGSARDIALLVSMPIPEVETYLENLIETQMITRRDNGALALADLPAAVERASVSAENGRKSLGRPRKGEAPDQYRMRLWSVREGGKSDAAETQDNLGGENPALARVAAKLSSEEAKPAAAASDVIALGNQVAEAARLDTARGVFDYRPIAAWLAEGATPELIVDVVEALAARPNYPQVKSLSYFNNAVRDAIAQRKTPVREVKEVSNPAFKQYFRDVELYVMGGAVGPQPVRPQGMTA